MAMRHAYTVLTVKSVDEDARQIEGIASTPTPDRADDIVDPMGAQFALPMPLLWQHDSRQPVGNVTFAKPNAEGIPFRAQIADVSEPGRLKDRLDEAWQSVKAGLVRAVSIGFQAIDMEPIKNGGWRFTKWEWLELSLVTIPANVEATITAIKTADRELRGHAIHRAGVTAKPTEKTAMTYAEQIQQFANKRAAVAARLAEIMAKAAEETRTLESDEAEEHDTLAAELSSIDKHLSRLRPLATQMAKDAAEAARDKGNDDDKRGITVRENPVITVARTLPKGRLFTRVAMAMMAGKGNPQDTLQYAKQFGDTPEVAQVLSMPPAMLQKAAVAPGTTTDPAWAAPLVAWQVMASEFVELLRPATVVGRIPGLRNVPFNIKFPIQTAGSTVAWVGEAKPKPVSKLAFQTGQMDETKIAGIVVITQELARFSSPSAEALVQSDLTAAIAQFIDAQFLDPAVAPLQGVHPGSITNGIAGIPSSGTDPTSLRRDIYTLFSNFAAANLGTAGAVWIMPDTALIALSMMVGPLGQPAFPGTGDRGNPTLFGLPVISSQVVPDTVSPAGDMIVLVRAPDILLADDGGVTIDVSSEAALQMSDGPDDPVTAATTMVSLWQNNLVGIRAERFIHWKRRRDAAVQYIAGAGYVPAPPVEDVSSTLTAPASTSKSSSK